MLLASLNEWFSYFGHFHPVVVHLPIGMLVVAFIMELLVWRNPALSVLHPAIAVCLLAGCISAVLSCVVGWFLSQEGGYAASTLAFHQWLGIGVALLSGLCWWMKRRSVLRPALVRWFRKALCGLLVVLTIAGHLGGNMTHGEDYLTAGLPQPVAGWLGIDLQKGDTAAIIRKPIDNIDQAVVYTDLVTPVFQEKCYSCHSAQKVKGGLRMDGVELLMKGGKHGAIILPGNTDGSELIRRLLLPKDNDKRMPPKDQPQLSEQELAMLRWWVQSGADTKKTVSEAKPDSAMLAALRSFQEGGQGNDTGTVTALSPVFALSVGAPDQAAIKALQQLGVLVAPVARNQHLLEVSCINAPGFGDEQVALLTRLADHIVWLKLDHTQVTDAALASVGQLKHLVRLDLSGTRVGPAGMPALKNLSYLEYLNLTATKIDDAGLRALVSLPALQHIYCWQSSVSAKGIVSFLQQKPATRIVGAADQLQQGRGM
ncbi:c-type cytochrome domain-containing protein [Paraflavitalea pollutisoli]|uniref:c-type cytochrome domain-containing protein n=1 Tax=Paraflavitalea pollutisoli TaxID=3034143 RepID=UPI0023EBCB5A|nr:c-type cytochrome domain-containing protein [Paraflavitalea sp. H1-2-19X]